MSLLKDKKCIPCEDGGSEHLLKEEMITEFLSEVSGWRLSENKKSISQEFQFPDFVKAMAFVEQVADVAEEENHHPDILIIYNKVLLTLSTHAAGGLTQNDFIVASRINTLWIV